MLNRNRPISDARLAQVWYAANPDSWDRDRGLLGRRPQLIFSARGRMLRSA